MNDKRFEAGDKVIAIKKDDWYTKSTMSEIYNKTLVGKVVFVKIGEVAAYFPTGKERVNGKVFAFRPTSLRLVNEKRRIG